MVYMGAVIFEVGLLSSLVGILLLISRAKSRDTEWKKFIGPAWFILIVFGFVMMAAGVMMPI